jgi:hypothetical protein
VTRRREFEEADRKLREVEGELAEELAQLEELEAEGVAAAGDETSWGLLMWTLVDWVVEAMCVLTVVCEV